MSGVEIAQKWGKRIMGEEVIVVGMAEDGLLEKVIDDKSVVRGYKKGGWISSSSDSSLF